jgi:hypothetical protein
MANQLYFLGVDIINQLEQIGRITQGGYYGTVKN